MGEYTRWFSVKDDGPRSSPVFTTAETLVRSMTAARKRQKTMPVAICSLLAYSRSLKCWRNTESLKPSMRWWQINWKEAYRLAAADGVSNAALTGAEGVRVEGTVRGSE